MPKLFIHTEGRGPAHLVLLHGWAMHGAAFAPLVGALREHWTLHLVDLPGHGRSRDSHLSLEPAPCAAAIAAQVPPAAWLGWSLGGLYALEAALDFPAQVRGLAMVCSSPCFVRRPDWRYAMTPEILASFGRDFTSDYASAVERFFALEAFGSDAARADLRTLPVDTFSALPPAPDALAEGLAVLARADLRARLRNLVPPSTWIAGRRDRLIPWQAMQWSAARCGGAFTRVAGAGHAPFIGHTADVAAAIERLAAALPA